MKSHHLALTISLGTIFTSIPFNCFSELYVDPSDALAHQIYTGSQPNQRTSEYVDLDLKLTARSDYKGIKIALGTDMYCEGDLAVQQIQRVRTTIDSLVFEVKLDPQLLQNYAKWIGSGTTAHRCYSKWRMNALATTTSEGIGVSITMGGYASSLTMNYTNSHEAPAEEYGDGNYHEFDAYKDKPILNPCD